MLFFVRAGPRPLCGLPCGRRSGTKRERVGQAYPPTLAATKGSCCRDSRPTAQRPLRSPQQQSSPWPTDCQPRVYASFNLPCAVFWYWAGELRRTNTCIHGSSEPCAFLLAMPYRSRNGPGAGTRMRTAIGPARLMKLLPDFSLQPAHFCGDVGRNQRADVWALQRRRKKFAEGIPATFSDHVIPAGDIAASKLEYGERCPWPAATGEDRVRVVVCRHRTYLRANLAGSKENAHSPLRIALTLPPKHHSMISEEPTQ